jgi:DinB superfamily
MKKSLFLIALISLFAFIRFDKALTKQERDFAVQYMEQSRDTLLIDVKGLSPAQLNWKADSTRWSVAQCVEHIALAEGLLMGVVEMNLKSPADPSKRDSLKYTDQQIMAFLTNRSQKFQAPEMLKPTGKFASYQAALDSFIVRRNRNIEFIKATQDDFRDHYWVNPGFGIIDDYQALLFMVAHSKRHTLQLKEVKTSPGFPK